MVSFHPETESSLLPRRAERLDGTLQSEEKIKQAFSEKELVKNLRRAAMDLLARREHSAYELAQKLQNRFGFSPFIDQQLNLLAEENLQSDSRFCEAYITSRARKGRGVIRIRVELRHKQIADSLIEQYLSELPIDWFALAASVRIKKYGYSLPKEPSERNRQARFLQYRGFDMEQIQYALHTEFDEIPCCSFLGC